MKLIRYLENVDLLKSVNEKQPNGNYVKTFNIIDTYRIVKKTLNDQISATIYGADIDKMLSISSPLGNLETLLLSKVNNKEDNISLYFIKIDDVKYKIKSVTNYNVIIERL